MTFRIVWVIVMIIHLAVVPALTAQPGAKTHRLGFLAYQRCPEVLDPRGPFLVKGYPFEVLLPAGLGVEGAILSDQIKSLDWRVRKARRICNLPAEVLQETVGKILALVEPDRAR